MIMKFLFVSFAYGSEKNHDQANSSYQKANPATPLVAGFALFGHLWIWKYPSEKRLLGAVTVGDYSNIAESYWLKG